MYLIKFKNANEIIFFISNRIESWQNFQTMLMRKRQTNCGFTAMDIFFSRKKNLNIYVNDTCLQAITAWVMVMASAVVAAEVVTEVGNSFNHSSFYTRGTFLIIHILTEPQNSVSINSRELSKNKKKMIGFDAFVPFGLLGSSRWKLS